MDGGGGGGPSRSTGGEFLLSLLQNRNQSQPPPAQSPTIDPAVAAVGPTVPTQQQQQWSSSSNNGHDLSSHPPPWSHQSSPFPQNFFLQGFPQNPWPPQPSGNNSQPGLSGDDVRRLGFQQKHKPELMFGSLPFELQNHEGLSNGNRVVDNSVSGSDIEALLSSRLEVEKKRELELRNLISTGLVRNRQFESQVNSNSSNLHVIGSYDNREQDRRGNGNGGWGRQEHGVVNRSSHDGSAVHKSAHDGGLTRQEHGLVNRSSHDGGLSRQELVNRSSHDGGLSRQELVNRSWHDGGLSRQEHGLVNRSSHDGGLSKQEHGLGNRSLHDGGLSRQEHALVNRSSHDGGLSRQEHGLVNRSSHDGGQGRQEHGVVHRSSQEMPRPPPGFSSNPRGGRNWDNGNRRRNFENNVGGNNGGLGELGNRVVSSIDEDERIRRGLPDNSKGHGYPMQKSGLTDQFDRPGPPTGSNLHSVKASGIEESLLNLHAEIDEIANELRYNMQDGTRRDVDGSNDKNDKKKGQNSRDKYIRSDTRGKWLLSQKMRNLKRQMICRGDIDMLNAPFLAIYESLIPTEEEKAKQKQLLTLLERLVSKEWPKAQLYLYGSCANSFDVSKSDIDVCLTIDDAEINKSDFLLRLAEILESDNLQNVQALTRARVPIVKLMDPVTGISCDICMNNVLAVVNTKLLRDYAQIDVRLRQLAFIVKHWAKSRGVNETYQGTLSSYAYVLMCIHFLQQRKPAVLPCLQGMETTYSVTVDDVKCAYFDQVEKLRGFGSHNKENIAQLVWAFFNYWAYCHDYANTAISVRTGSIISKQSKDWTTRVGNDRHLICIEDPFQTSHDLGRVVDKFSIKVLREEFERAAHIMQYDPNPCVKLFEPYVPEGRLLNV